MMASSRLPLLLAPLLGATLASQCEPTVRQFATPGNAVDTGYPNAIWWTNDLVAGPDGSIWHSHQAFPSRPTVHRWNGEIWEQGIDAFHSPILLRANGEVLSFGNTDPRANPQLEHGIIGLVGTSWQSLSPPVSYYTPYAMAEMPNGDIFAGGGFYASNPNHDLLLRWDGSTWTRIGNTNVPSDEVRALCVGSDGLLYAGGSFAAIDSVSVNGLARFNGTTWSTVGGSLPAGGRVLAIANMQNGDLVVGGDFTSIGGIAANRVARWNGSSWSAFGNGVDGTVVALQSTVDGGVVAAGLLGVGSSSPYIQRWDGTAWQGMGGGTSGPVQKLGRAPNGDVLAAGVFDFAGDQYCRNVARWDGSAWHAIGFGFAQIETLASPRVRTAATDFRGDLVVGGEFDRVAGKRIVGLARWDGSDWQPVGLIEGGSRRVDRLIRARDGRLFVFGSFTSIDGLPVTGIPYHDATGWHFLPPSLPGGTGIRGFFEDANGDLYFSFGTVVQRWDGATWTQVGPPVVGYISSIIRLRDGDLVFGGGYGFAAAINIGRVRPNTIVPLPSANPDRSVEAMALDANGDLLAVGQFLHIGSQPIHGFARWNASGWQQVPTTMSTSASPLTLHRLPDGDLVGEHSGFDAIRFDGVQWTQFHRLVDAFAVLPSGDLAFAVPDSLNQGTQLEIHHNTCPAAAAAFGTACPSSGGSNTLATNTPPWIGGTFTSHATGLPTSSIVAVSTGFATHNQPLNLILPMAAPSCEHRVVMDMLDLHVTTDGTTSWTRTVPDTMTLVGVTAYQQMFPLEVDAALDIVTASATNALQLTIGKFL